MEHREERPERVRGDEALGAPSERPRRRRGAGVLVGRHRRHGHRGADDPPDLRRVAGTRVDRAGAPPRGRSPGSRGRGDVARRVSRCVISRASMDATSTTSTTSTMSTASRARAWLALLFKRLHARYPRQATWLAIAAARAKRPAAPGWPRTRDSARDSTRTRRFRAARFARAVRRVRAAPSRSWRAATSRARCASGRRSPGNTGGGVLLSRLRRREASRRGGTDRCFTPKTKRSRRRHPPRVARAVADFAGGSAGRGVRRERSGRCEHRHPRRRCVRLRASGELPPSRRGKLLAAGQNQTGGRGARFFRRQRRAHVVFARARARGGQAPRVEARHARGPHARAPRRGRLRRRAHGPRRRRRRRRRGVRGRVRVHAAGAGGVAAGASARRASYSPPARTPPRWSRAA